MRSGEHAVWDAALAVSAARANRDIVEAFAALMEPASRAFALLGATVAESARKINAALAPLAEAFAALDPEHRP